MAGATPYDVVVASSFVGLGQALDRLGFRRCVVITDDVVGPLWSEELFQEIGARSAVVVVPHGESQKRWETLQSLIDDLLSLGVDRTTCLVVLGGGVTSDVGGLAAALVLRGLPWVVVPTTLLAMVDASIGGKVAINHASGKNLIGAFHPPSLVWTATCTLSTLDAAEVASGYGEVLKSALVGDGSLVDELSAGPVDVGEVIVRCAGVKARVVSSDEREKGDRVVLNAGHTVGHALEVAAGFGVLRHGEAVALGLVTEAAWAVAEGVCVDPQLPARLRAASERLGLPVRAPTVERAAMRAAMGLDKKASGDTLKLPVPVCAGRVAVIDLPRWRLPELLEHLPE